LALAPLQASLDLAARVLKDRTVRLAVTGLSRAGKTVFITSAIHNLMAAPTRPGVLPALAAARERRLVAVHLVPPHAGGAPAFPYAANVAAMSGGASHWPAATEDISAIALEIRFRPRGLLRGALATLRVELIDYPGEWLLDLPLLDRSFADWSRDMVALSEGPLRAELARAWRDYIAAHSASFAADEEVARRAHALYRDYLLRCKDAHALSYLQPGRMVCPGRAGESEAIRFCPMPPDAGRRYRGGTLGALMENRYEAFKAQVRADFLAPYFARLHRQIVLVDLLRALASGRDSFEDTARALTEITRVLRGRGWLRRLFGGTKTLFAATKADHVPEAQRGQLTQLLANLVGGTVIGARRGADAGLQVTRLAAVRCTEDREPGGALKDPAVVGLPVGGGSRVAFYIPGGVPVEPPSRSYFGNLMREIPTFQPPMLDAKLNAGIPQIGLDLALEAMIGDYLA
jgi:predicted YcjX-like family ATPase